MVENIAECEKIIEAVLFASGEGVTVASLASIVGLDVEPLRIILGNLKSKWAAEGHATVLVETGDTVALSTNPEYYEHVRKLLTVPRQKLLTQALLETLAIIAYKQPVTKAQIEEIRGVNADHAVNKLLEYNLICELGRLDTIGKPIIFGTTDDFLRHFGLPGLEKLPDPE